MYQLWYYIKSLHSATADLLFFSVQIFKNVEGSSIFLSLKVCFLYLILLGKKPKFLKKVEMYLNEWLLKLMIECNKIWKKIIIKASIWFRRKNTQKIIIIIQSGDRKQIEKEARIIRSKNFCQNMAAKFLLPVLHHHVL